MAKSFNAITSNARGTVPKNGLYLLDDTVATKYDIPARRSGNIAKATHFYATPSAGPSDKHVRSTEHLQDRVRAGGGDTDRARLRRAHSDDSVAPITNVGVSIPAGKIQKRRSVTSNSRSNQPNPTQDRRPSASPKIRAAAAPSTNKPIAAAASSIAKERAVMNDTLNALLQSVLGKSGFVAPTDHRSYSAMIAKAVKKIKNPAQLEAFKTSIEEAGKPFKLNFGLSRLVEGKKEALNARATGSLDSEHQNEYKKIVDEFQSSNKAPAQTGPSTSVPNQVPVNPASALPVSRTQDQGPAETTIPTAVQNQSSPSVTPQTAPQSEGKSSDSANLTTRPNLYDNPQLIA